jgi:hypothetical protein
MSLRILLIYDNVNVSNTVVLASGLPTHLKIKIGYCRMAEVLLKLIQIAHS